MNDALPGWKIEQAMSAYQSARHEGWVDGRAGKPDLFDPTQERETHGEKTEQ